MQTHDWWAQDAALPKLHHQGRYTACKVSPSWLSLLDLLAQTDTEPATGSSWYLSDTSCPQPLSSLSCLFEPAQEFLSKRCDTHYRSAAQISL